MLKTTIAEILLRCTFCRQGVVRAWAVIRPWECCKLSCRELGQTCFLATVHHQVGVVACFGLQNLSQHVVTTFNASPPTAAQHSTRIATVLQQQVWGSSSRHTSKLLAAVPAAQAMASNEKVEQTTLPVGEKRTRPGVRWQSSPCQLQCANACSSVSCAP